MVKPKPQFAHCRSVVAGPPCFFGTSDMLTNLLVLYEMA
jgi:hypothetical protein